jgi:hypothetical protein
MNRNGRHDRKGKGDEEQNFSHTPSVIASARGPNEIQEVFCFQKTDSATIRVLSGPEIPPKPHK